MICKIGESRQDKLTSGTYGSVTVSAYMLAAAVNTALATADYNPALVNVKLILRRQGRTNTIMQDNLQILGVDAALKKGLHEFVNGYDKVYPAAAAKAQKIRTVTIPFSPIRLSGNDELIMEVVPAQSGTFGAAVDTGSSYIEFFVNPTIGYEIGIPSIKSEVVQQNTSNQSFNLGDNVTKLSFLNFDKNDLSSEVITNLNLSSDRLDVSYTFNRLLALQHLQFDEAPAMRYGSVLPIHQTDATGRSFRGLDYLPQSLVIFDGGKIANELDSARVECSFNSPNVGASQNYFVWHTYETDIATIKEAKEREEKHLTEKIQKVASTK